MPFTSLVSIMNRVTANRYNSTGQNLTERGNHKVAAKEEAYLSQMDEIRRLTPKGRLLEFDVQKHSWAELANFTGRQAPPGKGFPRRKSNNWTHDDYLTSSSGYKAMVVWSCLHAINEVIVAVLLMAILKAVRHCCRGLRPCLKWQCGGVLTRAKRT